MNYLVLIGQVELLAVLFDRVVLPAAVQAELNARKAPPLVRRWITNPPAWLDVRAVPSRYFDDDLLQVLDEGENAAIALAASLDADLLLMDDREGVVVARKMGLRVTGTLGILDLAAERGLTEFAKAIERLRHTNFRRPEALLDAMLKKHAQE